MARGKSSKSSSSKSSAGQARAGGGLTLRRPGWASAEGQSIRAESLESGPSSLRGLFQWPSHVIGTLSPTEASQLDAVIQDTLCIYSDYSGMDTYRHALVQIQMAYDRVRPGTWPATSMRFARVCDKEEVPQQILMAAAHELGGGNSCVFGDICHRLGPEAARLYTAAEPSDDADPMMKVAGYQAMLEWFIDNRAWAYADSVPCLVHRKLCPVHPANAQLSHTASGTRKTMSSSTHGGCAGNVHKRRRLFDEVEDVIEEEASTKPIYINTSGMTCVGWSSVRAHSAGSVGGGGGHTHESEKVNHTWLCERLRFAELGLEHIFFGECVVGYPVNKIRKVLHRTHEVITIIFGPEHLGWPVKRPRMLCMGINREHFRWVGGADWEQRFREKHFRNCILPGTALLAEAEEARWAYYAELAAIQCNHMPISELKALEADELMETLLPSYSLAIRQRYKKLQHKLSSLGGAFLADVEQNPGAAAAAGLYVPCLLTHGLLMSFEHQAQPQPVIFTATEHMTAQGAHLVESMLEDYPAIQIAPILNNLSARQLKKLAGNGMHFHVVAAWLVFCLSNSRRVPSESIRSLSGASATEEDSDQKQTQENNLD